MRHDIMYSVQAAWHLFVSTPRELIALPQWAQSFEPHPGVGFLDGVHQHVKAHPMQSLCLSENDTNVIDTFHVRLALHLRLMNP